MANNLTYYSKYQHSSNFQWHSFFCCMYISGTTSLDTIQIFLNSFNSNPNWCQLNCDTPIISQYSKYQFNGNLKWSSFFCCMQISGTMSLDKVRTLLNFSTPTIPAISLKENESEGDQFFNTKDACHGKVFSGVMMWH